MYMFAMSGYLNFLLNIFEPVIANYVAWYLANYFCICNKMRCSNDKSEITIDFLYNRFYKLAIE